MSSAARQATRSLTEKIRRVANRRPTSLRSWDRMPPATSTTFTVLVANGPVALRPCDIQSRASGSPRRWAMSTSESIRITAGDAHRRGDGNGHQDPAGPGRRPAKARRRNSRWRRDPTPGRYRSERVPDRSAVGSVQHAKFPARGPPRQVSGSAPHRGRYSFCSYTTLYIVQLRRHPCRTGGVPPKRRNRRGPAGTSRSLTPNVGQPDVSPGPVHGPGAPFVQVVSALVMAPGAGPSVAPCRSAPSKSTPDKK